MTTDSISGLYELFIQANGISTDTRKVEKNQIFFALKGDNFDGNLFAVAALQKGASYAVIDDISVKESAAGTNRQDRLILVPDVLQTLQQLATYHRNTFDIPVLAISGSNGKTTTKELIRNVLATTYNVHSTTGNLNNHIGVPLTLLAMPKDTDFAVIEMGANHQGEIADLCAIANPNFGLLTNIGEAHLEGFGGIEGVKKGKGEMVDFLSKNNGSFFFNTNEDHLEELAQKVENRISYGDLPEGQADYSILALPTTKNATALYQDDGWAYRVFSPMMGMHNFQNIKTAMAVGTYFKVPFLSIKYAIEEYAPKNMRSQIIQRDSNHIYLDAYNANPTSMRKAIASFAESKLADNQVVILGDMLELGKFSQQSHQEIMDFVGPFEFSKVILVGPEFAKAMQQHPNSRNFTHMDDVEQLKLFLSNQPFRHTAFFVKGSRGIRLEKAFL